MFDEVFVIIDALDECTTADELMAFVRSAVRWKLASLHLLVTSRRIVEIEEVLGDSIDARQSLAEAEVDEDIKLHVSHTLQYDKYFRRWDATTLLEIEKVLIEGGSGM